MVCSSVSCALRSVLSFVKRANSTFALVRDTTPRDVSDMIDCSWVIRAAVWRSACCSCRSLSGDVVVVCDVMEVEFVGEINPPVPLWLVFIDDIDCIIIELLLTLYIRC